MHNILILIKSQRGFTLLQLYAHFTKFSVMFWHSKTKQHMGSGELHPSFRDPLAPFLPENPRSTLTSILYT